MNEVSHIGVTELREDECAALEGGTTVRVVTYLTGCFAAGFNFGYNTLGPALFG